MTSESVMIAHYDYRSVLLSIAVSILAACAALALAERIKVHGKKRIFWLIGGAVANGIGTWSMHYTAMLGFRLPVPVLYHWPTVLLSLLVGIVGSGIALFVMSRRAFGFLQPVAASVVLGSVGISGLHYIAMSSMRFQGMCRHSPALVVVSVSLAIAFSLAALSLTFLDRIGWNRLWSAILLGAANPVMHYTAMAGTSFVFSNMAPNVSRDVTITSIGVVSITIVPLMVLIVALLTSSGDRLQKQRALLDSLFQQAPEAVALLDAAHKVVRVNHGFTRLFGYTAQEAEGQRISELIVPNQLLAEYHRYQDLVENGRRVDAEGVRCRKDGSLVDVSILQVPVRLPGEEIVVYASYREITERKRVEQRLREYEKAVEGLDQMIAVVDRDYRYVVANQAFLSSRGLKREELVGRRINDVVNPGVFESIIKEKVDQAFEGNVVHYEMTYTYPKLGTRDLFVSYFPIEGPAGVDRVVAILKDVTESKQAEEQLKAKSEQLRALSASLQSAKEEESARIAREIHDELGAALSSLRWDLEDITETVSVLTDPSQSRDLREKIERMMRLTDTTVNIVRRIASELRPIALDALGLSEAIQWQARQFQERTGIAIQLDGDQEDIDLTAEQSIAVFRIFQEALTNILRHAQATNVHIELRKENGEVVLTISDNGRGITEEEKSGERTLGLLGMRERAHLSGGTIEITSSQGQGTVLAVRIPTSGEKDPHQPTE